MGFHHVHFVFGLSMISYVFCVDPASIRPVPSSSFLSFAVELCQCLCLPALAPLSWCTCVDAGPFQFGCTFAGCVCGAVSLSRSGLCSC